jgi:ferredoxin
MMKAVVDRETCIGCGLCESTCPDLFVMDDEEKAKVIVAEIAKQAEECAKQAAVECPVTAITLE